MEKLVEVRWHGRGGQGAVTASKLFSHIKHQTPVW